MSPDQFVRNIKAEIESLVSLYAQGAEGQTAIGTKLDSLNLSPELQAEVVSLIEQAIKESTYNLIGGLEGSASLAGTQEKYKITDERGNELSGELDVLFYEQVMK
ncbi:hypothetical protein [Gilvimarinus algae]|uniref:Uncharacterized protein n=1 Tax=Gilvimarinus algae TaxID=3058037 RepID=A0ABT8TCG9_9GAMM|nr:hypothetical protein [Gilvimarinus sp. SDUM040014]MDO3380818.1 hypothetical protein [Gilvimarinus sp. SDUM040014]